jgi:hypothetical protein
MQSAAWFPSILRADLRGTLIGLCKAPGSTGLPSRPHHPRTRPNDPVVGRDPFYPVKPLLPGLRPERGRFHLGPTAPTRSAPSCWPAPRKQAAPGDDQARRGAMLSRLWLSCAHVGSPQLRPTQASVADSDLPVWIRGQPARRCGVENTPPSRRSC